MNMQIFRKAEVLANLNKSFADELNQPTSFSIIIVCFTEHRQLQYEQSTSIKSVP